MPKRVPADLRPKAFAGVELLLDFCHAARSISDIDLESMVIYFCVAEATMRPLMLAPETPPEMRTHSTPDARYRGAISMLLVADKLGLPRETVRRKIKALIRRGLLVERSDGKVQSTPNITDPDVRRAASATYAAVGRYIARLKQFDVPNPGASARTKT